MNAIICCGIPQSIIAGDKNCVFRSCKQQDGDIVIGWQRIFLHKGGNIGDLFFCERFEYKAEFLKNVKRRIEEFIRQGIGDRKRTGQAEYFVEQTAEMQIDYRIGVKYIAGQNTQSPFPRLPNRTY